MFRRLHQRVKAFENRLNSADFSDLDDPATRRRAYWHFQLMDHAFLRVWWTNFFPVTKGVYRSNQPSPARLRRYHDLGIRAILNLRGRSPLSFYQIERTEAERLGMTIVDLPLSARAMVPPERLIELEHVFRTIPQPFVLHCKSGADRAGFASALYLMMIEGAPVEVAQRQLSLKYVHLKRTKTGVLDHFLRYYAREQKRTGITLMEWIRTGYDPEEITRSFHDWQKGKWEAE